MTGRARDLLTTSHGAAVELANASFSITASTRREILEIVVDPPHPRSAEMVGVRAGGASREALKATMGDLRGTPQFQLLDDFAGASLVAGWIWSEWVENWQADLGTGSKQPVAGRTGAMENICTGFATGASSLGEDGQVVHGSQSRTEVGPLENPDDPQGWHELATQFGPQMRRARRIDLFRDGVLLRADIGFQDSGSSPSGTRTAIHEYRVHAEIDPNTMTLASIQALPLILPFRECPGASIKVGRLVGQPLGEFRDSVLNTLPGTMGCTHLNDVLRALADVPTLSEKILIT
ncbi:DUF2889 domain-containing protein [Novosphingobium sp. Gsoil 351]|uniref:DUF2889 domain-containing protein n=1 Tax=Novosphingobium sp. Gsoil 351 TaxID=2675225 RepID=UPI0018A84C94|nr:DUF2889 domain-containing protein [Novosphingobium sp. Gsoil 351]